MGARLEVTMEESSPQISVPLCSQHPIVWNFIKFRNIISRYLPVLFNDSKCAPILTGGIKPLSRRAPTLGRYLSLVYTPALVRAPIGCNSKALSDVEAKRAPIVLS